MSIKDRLKIVLITYNRCVKLRDTLNKIFEDNSPIKDFDITILDNASTDNTKNVCLDFQTQHNNLKYICNCRNVGISGNIIKAMELAEKEWHWIICDDDDFDWSNWDEIENALNEDYDIVHTTYTVGYRNITYPYLINEEAFLPTSIYNSKHITSITLQNAYAIAHTLLPHQAIGCKVLNEGGKIFIPENRLVIQCYEDKFNYIRAKQEGIYQRLTEYQILAGYINVYQLINDEKLRDECLDVLCLGKDFAGSMNWFLDTNPNDNLFNIFEILLTVSDNKKAEFIRCLTNKHKIKYFDFIQKLVNYDNNNFLNIKKDFEQIKQTIINLSEQHKLIIKKLEKPPILQQIFSVKNEGRHKVLRILGIKFKFRRTGK